MLNSLPDDVLLAIFSFLDARDLSNMSLVCGRFWRLANNRTLWEQIDLSLFCLGLQRLWKLMHIRFPRTLKALRVRGYAKAYSGTPRWKTETVSPPLLVELAQRCPNIESLQLIEVYFSDRTRIVHFPPSLVSLSLCGCQFSSSSSWFQAKTPPPNLRHLDLSQCPGITQKALLHVCEWRLLESLSLKDCYNITDTSASVITTQLNKLRRLDIRGTNITDATLTNIGLNLTKLERLKVGGSVGSHMSSIRNRRLTDVGIRGFGQILGFLSFLNISGTAITNESIRFIAQRAKVLRQLVVNNVDITIETVQDMEKIVSQCHVVHQLSPLENNEGSKQTE